ncbi:ATP-binding protein [Streptomyces sp. NPDC050439]|uniref:ATP-binding protein n=1 Tax=unclassified Streptomyces TaxID=2593676 RepID=UPI0034446627
MDQTAGEDGQPSADSGSVSISQLFEGSEGIARARHLARDFLTDLRSVYGLPVTSQAMGMVELVVSELVTNARKYAPGPCLLALAVQGANIEVSVRDSNSALPAVSAPDPSRLGQHGLEVVQAVCHKLQVDREPSGKRITAVLGLAADADGSPADRHV